jgi:hypothetical protein
MKTVRRMFLAFLPFLIFAPGIFAQTTAVVTATVTDPNGTPCSFGTVIATLSPAGVSPTVNGQTISGTSGPAALDVTGFFSMTLFKNSSISPGGTQWSFQVNCNSNLPPPVGTGGQVARPAPQTINTDPTNLSSVISAALPLLTNINGGGGGGNVSGSGASPQVTVWSALHTITGFSTLTYTQAAGETIVAGGAADTALTLTGATSQTGTLFSVNDNCSIAAKDGAFTLCGTGTDAAAYYGFNVLEDIATNNDSTLARCMRNNSSPSAIYACEGIVDSNAAYARIVFNPATSSKGTESVFMDGAGSPEDSVWSMVLVPDTSSQKNICEHIMYNDWAAMICQSNDATPLVYELQVCSDFVKSPPDCGGRVGAINIDPEFTSASSGNPIAMLDLNVPPVAGNCVKFGPVGSITGSFPRTLQSSGAPCGGGTPTFPLTVAGTVNSGGIPYFNSTTQESSSAVLPSGDFVLGGGAGGAPTATFSIIPVVNGGTGTATPGLIAGTNITITGTWPNQTINASGGGTPAFPITVTGGVSGAIPCFTSTTVESVSTLLAANGLIFGGGAGVCPSSLATPTDSQTYQLTGTAGAAPVWALAGVVVKLNTTTTTYVILSSDRGKMLQQSNAGAEGYTLAQAGSTGFTNAFYFRVRNDGAGLLTITPTTSTIARTGQAAAATLVVAQGETCNVQADSTNTNYIADCSFLSTDNILAIANGGTGTASPGLIAGTNITITGSWPNQTINASGGGSGTVTSFSAGNLSPLFTTSVATATTTPALTFSLSNAGANTVFGNATSGSAAPGFTTNPAITSLTLVDTTAMYVAYSQGATSAAKTACAAANTWCVQAPTAVTAGLETQTGTHAQGIPFGVGNSSAIQDGTSGDANHSASVTIGSGTSIGSTSLCSTANCPVGTYDVNVYVDITTACGTTGTYLVNLIYTDDQGSKTVPVNIQGTGAVPATGILTTTSTANFGQGSQILRSTGAASINYSTTATACGTAGPMVGKLYLSVVPRQ